jgi:peptide deformylase
MSKNYTIITVPDPVLKQVAQPVARVDEAVRAQMDAMLVTMYDAPGIGLAANQVSLLNRVLVMDISRREEGEGAAPICMANPEIIWESEEISVMEEGCLSIPRQYAEVERPASVRVKYLDYEGKEAELKAEGLLSHCVQHEIDHLNGVLFIDYLSSLKRNVILRKIEKLKKQAVL